MGWRLDEHEASYLDGIESQFTIYDGTRPVAYAFLASEAHKLTAAAAMLEALKATTRILHAHIGQLDTGEIHELEIAKTVLVAAEPEEGR